MAEPDAVTPIPARLTGQEAAVAGTQGAIFTAADRKIIEDRTDSPIDRSRSFIEAFKSEGLLMPKVENEVGTNKPEPTLFELKSRERDYRHIIKHSTITQARDQVNITNLTPDAAPPEVTPAPIVGPQETAGAPLVQPVEKVTIGEEKKAPPKTIPTPTPPQGDLARLFDQLQIEQKDLASVMPRIRTYHLTRLLSENEADFMELSKKIVAESLAVARPENRPWLEDQLKKITLGAAQYKLNLLTSLESMKLDDRHKQMIGWLTKLIEQLDQEKF
jgi:hypothetical protein